MDFLGKLGNMARSFSDKTGDMLEISKLNAQIRSKEDDIEELKLKLGDYIWNKFASGVIMDNQATAICGSIRSAYDEIRSCKAEISEIRRAQEEDREQAAREAEARAQLREQAREIIREAPAQGFTLCPVCGAELPPDSRFCGGCGARI